MTPASVTWATAISFLMVSPVLAFCILEDERPPHHPTTDLVLLVTGFRGPNLSSDLAEHRFAASHFATSTSEDLMTACLIARLEAEFVHCLVGD
jgi:hypothetical protein